MTVPILGALALLGGLAGCPGPDENAPTLWLALDGRETEVKLVEFEPPPY
jgi:hypothetical protein